MKPPRLSALDRKLLRDAERMWVQLLAIALVLACGAGFFLAMRATIRSLESAKSQYYAHQRFGEVFAGLVRAPERVAGELAAIPGVRRLETRVVADVTLDVPGMREAAVGRLVSLPEEGRPAVNGLVLRAGRLPEAGSEDEVVASEAFVEAHGLPLGASIGAVLNGRWKRLRVVGSALSPEYLYSVGPGSVFPDDRRFGVFWMRRGGLAAAFDMQGAFNDVSILLDPGAEADAVIERVDAVLARYGGRGAYPRKDQQSAFYIDNELEQLATFAMMVPVLFLVVGAFLLYLVIGRIVAIQREQIAALKALGYRDTEVGLHYAKLVGLIAVVGVLLGIAVASWFGAWMTRMYADYYRFPDLPFRMTLGDVAPGILLSLAAAALGAWTAVAHTIRMPPAEAMRPSGPPTFRPTLLERLQTLAWIPPSARIVLREVERKPLRAGLSILGIALATALTVFNAFTLDALAHMLNVQFGLIQREDVQVQLFEPRSLGALRELEHLPGVLHAEPYRSVPVRLRASQRSRNLGLTGLPAGGSLYKLLDLDLQEIPVPPAGVLLSKKLAEILGVEAGDTLQVEVLEGRRAVRRVRVERITETYVGLTAHMELEALSRLLGETPDMNGARLLVDEGRLPELHDAVKRTPVVAGVTSRDRALRVVEDLLDQSLGTWVIFSIGFSLVMALGVLYNAARITLSERARELASLRVLGFRRREVGAILLGEIGVLTAVALPVGLLLGRLLAAALVESPGFQTEQFRLPLVIHPATYALAVTTVLASAALSGWAAWRRLDRMDLTEVLKTRE